MDYSIKVGLYDWVKFPAKNSFYPDDLPADWKLSFYANEFETACIKLCGSAQNQFLGEWVEDLPDSFQLSFHASDLDQLAELPEQSDYKCQYLIMEQQQRDILLQNNSSETVLLKAGVSNTEQVVSSSSLWTPENNVESSNIALMPDSDDNRLYRRWIELWLADNSQQNLTLWLDGTTARYSTVSQLRTLVELMGY